MSRFCPKVFNYIISSCCALVNDPNRLTVLVNSHREKVLLMIDKWHIFDYYMAIWHLRGNYNGNKDQDF